MVTIHSYTNDQQILDLPHKDLRRARAAALSMIPTTTGAAKATSLVIPEVKGKDRRHLDPRPDARRVVHDLTVEVEKAGATKESVNAAFKKAAAEGPLVGILRYTEEELVSSDYIGDPASCILDAKTTNVVDGTLVKCHGWYDNEWGYASRCVDMLRFMGVASLGRDEHEKENRPRSHATRRCAASAHSSASTSTFRSMTTATSPTTRASAPRFRRSSFCSSAARVPVILSHLGRPKGKPEPKYSLAAGGRRVSAS